jgi:hypothetical protein
MSSADEIFRKMADESLAASEKARQRLTKKEVVYYGTRPSTAGLLFINYANMVNNRVIDLYDDTVFLLNNGRIPAACVIARCLMETHAVGLLACRDLERSLKNNGLDGAGEVVLRFINSSRFKQEEQDKLKEGKFSLEDLHFTEEAKARMLQESAVSVHVMKAMRYLFELDMKETGNKESGLEIFYSTLCEWTHPSQTSLFHNYAPAAQKIQSRYGTVSLLEAARFSAVNGLRLIQSSENLYELMIGTGKALHQDELKPR